MKKLIMLIIFAFIFSTSALAKGSPWISVETLYENARDTTSTTSMILKEGKKYKIIVSGTYFAGDEITADAQCSYREGSSTEWTQSVSTYEYLGESLLDLLVDGQHDWGDCSSDHEYSMIVWGEDTSLDLYIWDTYPWNNDGSLTIEIFEFTGKNNGYSPNACTNIQSGELLASDGSTIMTGYDMWGYNYQANLFNGSYCDSYRDADWCQPYKDINLSMKWDDTWMSNKDCSGDSKLDRHYGFDSYIGSGAWLTNHQSGEYEEGDAVCKWNYFVKIVAAPADATSAGGIWYAADGTEIGSVIWGQFAIVQQVENDSCAGLRGLQYVSPKTPGFGFYMP